VRQFKKTVEVSGGGTPSNEPIGYVFFIIWFKSSPHL